MDEKRDVIFTKSFDCIIDMDVKHGIKRVEIDCNVYMQHTKKSFPDVEELMIGPDVDEICIPNTLFPNVQMVYSDSIFFLAGRYLVKKRNGRPTLLNAFCKDEALEISVIVSIADYALANSNIKKIPYNYSALIRCEPMAFKDSYFEKQPFVNGVKTAGRIIVAIDPEADEAILPDEEYSMAVCAVGVNLADVKHLVIHNPNSICAYSIKGVPKEVTFVTTQETHYNHIINVMHAAKPGDGYYVEKVNIIDKNGKFVEKDGVVYTADMKRLIACSLSVTDLVIPEGVEEIISYAFANTRIKNVKFPDSLAILNENAFYKCRELQNVDFGSGLDIIKGFAFQNCTSLTHVKLPPQMKSIERYAFGDSGVENIELNEGLLRFGHKALFRTDIKSVHLPASIKNMEYDCFGSNLKELTMETFPPDFGAACIMMTGPFDADNNKIIKVYCNGKHLYFPRIIQPSMSSYAIDEMKYFFKNPRIKTVSMCKYAFSISCQGKVALLECLDFGSESAREHIKKYSYSILSNMIQEGSEKFAAKIVETGLVSNDILQKMIPKAENAEMFTLKAYMLNQLNLNGVQEEKISYAI